MGDVMEALTTRDLHRWMQGFAADIQAAESHLSELDAAAGDADHGSNLARGLRAVLAALPGLQGPPGLVCKEIGLVLVDTIGGSSGALYGTIFLRLAQAAGLTSTEIDLPALAQGFRAAAQGITDRGRAQRGDKTMLDAIGPAADALTAAVAAETPLASAMSLAAQAAEGGAEATRAMQARRGKASYVGMKSIGTADPGAASAALLIRSLAAHCSASKRLANEEQRGMG